MDLACCNHSGHCADQPDRPFCDLTAAPGGTLPGERRRGGAGAAWP